MKCMRLFVLVAFIIIITITITIVVVVVKATGKKEIVVVNTWKFQYWFFNIFLGLDGDYLNTSGAEAGTGEEYINNEAEQKTQRDGSTIVGGGGSGRHAEPTPSDTEAANILTTIKSGDLLRNSDGKPESSANTTTITMTTLASPTSMHGQNTQDNVKILFSSEPTNKIGTLSNKSVQKTTTVTYTNSNTGDLDALASAALQASSGMR